MNEAVLVVRRAHQQYRIIHSAFVSSYSCLWTPRQKPIPGWFALKGPFYSKPSQLQEQGLLQARVREHLQARVQELLQRRLFQVMMPVILCLLLSVVLSGTP